jgi:hypothetical protein
LHRGYGGIRLADMDTSPETKRRLLAVERGTRWFGLLGRVLLLIGVGSILVGIVVSATDFAGPASLKEATELWISGSSSLVTGWLFLLVRDALRTLAEVVLESADIV